MVDDIRQWVLQHRELILDTNRRLVSIPSENLYPRGNELRVQQEVKQLLEELGFETQTFLPTDVPGLVEHPAFLNDGRVYDQRPNVVGRLRGAGNGKSLIFSGHMDTVPQGIDAWTQNPFGGDVVGDRQYGLGIFDMKGGMVAAMMAARCLSELGYRLKGDVLIETVVDEEFGGANATLSCRLAGIEADAAIVPEPSNLAIGPINQGGVYFRVSFQGVPGRNFSGEKVVNPVYAAARFLEVVRQYHEWRNKHAAVPPLFEWNPELVTLVQVLRAGNTQMELADRVPSTCSFDVWIQCFPGTTEEELTEEFTRFYQPLVNQDELLSQVPPVVEKKIRFLPGTGIPADHPIVQTLEAAGRQTIEEGLPTRGAAFACDSFMFNLYSNTPAVILGPTGGNAHAPDEFIYVDDFLRLVEVYARTIANWCEATKN
ncbi:M20/M25/M40 family metallo-hydrolase [Alicyclobacillus tolerans]|uniref:M20/M25/M40 family metallo-hydrolase n=1 Tax=Alicyclobacillus tolerans TaxID=90970 RepID=UPI001F3C6D24|nr:M20/M25/M40 family metallo-hydrolase [Alicyclobacillus tolerans]MCF8566682.1 M20/M25/M40 family metallo-hydrolase [Alicyclobacillus tolerans]